ncbi:hypothetical protein MKW98_018872 [Papaver atlanticum]|uniref:Prephenate dehydratase domain-containing protein n=1 Tax=Papaver atlanticum TaxID=357466 RepID=A0AAD4TJC5_9MAGN|nr:hypothetical protein MKW98_018872 [Papaver atlanticum]
MESVTEAAGCITSMPHMLGKQPMSKISFLNQKTKRIFIKSSVSVKKSTLKVVSAKASSQSDINNLGYEDMKINQPLRVAYKGVPGENSEWAASKVYPNCKLVPYERFDIAFDAVESGIVDRAVLPIENSLGRNINRNYDLLLGHNLYIVGEVSLSIKHCLLAHHGVKIEDMNRVLSHPQALESVDDTAGAEEFVAAADKLDVGAVASEDAAKIYDLILGPDIQDDPDYASRFLMLAREPININPAGADRPFKTSIAFSSEEGPVMLFKALDVFKMWQINLTRIRSRPLQKQPTDTSGDGSLPNYTFCFDFEASIADPKSQNAIGQLKEFGTVRVLGSYPWEGTL